MDLPPSYSEKFRPRDRKIGLPRNEREELVERFRSRLNDEQKRDGRPTFSYARLAKRFDGLTNPRLYQLFNECDDPNVKSFGAMLTYKLRKDQG
ncbi:MAG: hypothetical protein J0I47_06135 [Sphingomonas sp.]|uniref:hypothetical protein n=1 Tax=Sphingomonas sp. TaxID=28214 RepID=UPI001AD4CF61|nr:hypothetical protein [Sphingomonas sp.]MBN8807798.1 hypothetical protein [Sphingomonas sp.]